MFRSCIETQIIYSKNGFYVEFFKRKKKRIQNGMHTVYIPENLHAGSTGLLLSIILCTCEGMTESSEVVQ